MKTRFLEPLLMASLLAGCASTTPPTQPQGASEAWVGDTLRAASMHRAIIVQSTLYPYHFVHGSAELNPLGERDLAVLADHISDHGGELNLHRGAASFELYAARSRSVLDALAEEGLDTAGLSIVDGTPGGDGMSGSRVITAIEYQPESTGDSSSTGMGTTSGLGGTQ